MLCDPIEGNNKLNKITKKKKNRIHPLKVLGDKDEFIKK